MENYGGQNSRIEMGQDSIIDIKTPRNLKLKLTKFSNRDKLHKTFSALPKLQPYVQSQQEGKNTYR